MSRMRLPYESLLEKESTTLFAAMGFTACDDHKTIRLSHLNIHQNTNTLNIIAALLLSFRR